MENAKIAILTEPGCTARDALYPAAARSHPINDAPIPDPIFIPKELALFVIPTIRFPNL